MARMIPAVARAGANWSERQLFTAFEGMLDRPDWVVFHSLQIRQHLDKLQGEADFVVAVPGRGVVVIEAKSPRSVTYRQGVWTLDGVPSPHKSPLEQADSAIRSIRSYLFREQAITGDEPFARLLWFTSIGRHHFGDRPPSDLSFFEWELAWADDLAHPAEAVEKVLDEHIAWHAESAHVDHNPQGMTTEKVDRIAASLARDFTTHMDERDAEREAQLRDAGLRAEQRFALELVGANRAVYLDGPAGTGKSQLLTMAAIDAIKRRERTLLTCWNIALADRLKSATAGYHGPVQVADLGTVMLRAAGLEAHPDDATDAWYQVILPGLAEAGLAAHPERGGYRHVIIDEFQDIAANPRLVSFVLSLAAPDAHIMLAGDERQQIMRPIAQRVGSFEVAKRSIPDLVHARVLRNCRQAPALVADAERIVGHPFGATGFWLKQTTPGGATRRQIDTGTEVEALAASLRPLVRKYGPADVAVLSPWGSRSTASRIMNGTLDDRAHAEDVRWLRANLGDGAGRVQYGSVPKLKGIEVDAIVLTDVGAEARAWAEAEDLDWDDLLYVALTRARYDAIVLEPSAADR